MPPLRILPFHPHDVPQVVELWNAAAREAYGFVPLTPEVFARRILAEPRFRPERLLLAREGGCLCGLAHADVVRERFLPPAGVVEALLVAPEARGRGVGRRLLREALALLDAEADLRGVDALGCYPYTPFYTTLIDGSERSGPFLDDAAMIRLLESEGFRRDRGSYVMERDLGAQDGGGAGGPGGGGVRLAERGERTWLDFVFRGWRLFDHHLVDRGGELLSRAIFGRMEGQSEARGMERYALFGVNTPPAQRGRGHARENLRRLLEEVRRRGGEAIELHVYADNTPALRLYDGLGFRVAGRTARFWRPREE